MLKPGNKSPKDGLYRAYTHEGNRTYTKKFVLRGKRMPATPTKGGWYLPDDTEV